MSLAAAMETAQDPRVAAIVARAQALYEDLGLQSVKQWKAEVAGRKAIGFLPIYVPREIIHAAGALPVGIFGGGDQIEIIRGDSYFQSYICHIPRSVIELAVSGRLDALDGFLFPSICDVIRNLSGMFKLLMPNKYVHYVDLPQNFNPSLGGRFYRTELASIARAVGQMTGVPVNDESLRASMAAYNAQTRAMRRLEKLRCEKPYLLPATEFYLVQRAGFLLPVEEHTAMLDAYREAVEASPRRPLDNIRILVRGAFCEQPPLGLLRTLERAGCYLVDDDLALGGRFIAEELPESGDPWNTLIEGFMRHSRPTASVYDADQTKGQKLIDAVRQSRADGVLLMAPSFCDPALLDQPMLQAALEKAGIPYTSFKYAEDNGQFQVIREQAGTFADAIKLWGSYEPNRR